MKWGVRKVKNDGWYRRFAFLPVYLTSEEKFVWWEKIWSRSWPMPGGESYTESASFLPEINDKGKRDLPETYE